MSEIKDLNKMTIDEMNDCYDLSTSDRSDDKNKCAICVSGSVKEITEPTVHNKIDFMNLLENKPKINQLKTSDSGANVRSSFSNNVDTESQFWKIHQLEKDAVSDKKSEMENLYAKNDLLGTLRGILERNVNIKTEILKYNLNKMLNINSAKNIKSSPTRSTEVNGFNQDEILFIEEQLDNILLEAESMVNGLINTNFNNPDQKFYKIGKYDNNALDSIDYNTVLSKSENLPPVPLEEHILEAPEGFRSNTIQLSCDSPQKAEPNELSDTGILLMEGLKCHCDAAAVEPERSVVTNHSDDNKLTQEVDTYRRAKQEEIKTCENNITITHGQENHANVSSLDGCETATMTTATITTTIMASVTDVNRNHELEKPHKEINEFRVNDGMKTNASECVNSYSNEKGDYSGPESILFDSYRHYLTTPNNYDEQESQQLVVDNPDEKYECDNRTEIENSINCSNLNNVFINENFMNVCKNESSTCFFDRIDKNVFIESILINSKFGLHENKRLKAGNDSKRKTINLTVSDKPKSELNLEQFLNKKNKFNYDNNTNKDRPIENISNSKTKSLFNLIVTDKPRKKVVDKIHSDNCSGSDKRKSTLQNEDNDQNSVEGRHVGSTTTTPTHLLGDTSRGKVKCCCIECLICNESTTATIPASNTIATPVFRNKCNLKQIKVDLNDLHRDVKKRDEKNGVSCPWSPTVRETSCCQYVESNVDSARYSDMPKSTTTTATATTLQSSSIETDVERCAELPGCSRESTVSAHVALDTSSCTSPTTTKQDTRSTENDRYSVAVEIESECLKSTEKNSDNQKTKRAPTEHLTWSFKNGRLVFEDAVLSSEQERESETTNILTSKELNRKSVEGRQLKLLEQKLKEAGIIDEINSSNTSFNSNKSNDEKYDKENSLSEDDDEDLIPEYEHLDFCEFDPNNSALSSLYYDNDADFYLVYDELLENEYLTCEMRGEGGMGTNVERKQHNPNHDNLKSLLKKPGHGRDSGKKNRVVFNETKNEFFDADYIILIREECDYDDEDDDGICTCNQHEMVRLTCCEPNCNCNVYDGYGDPTPQSPKFAPPLEFVDSVTLSPPEEYKDMELEEQQLMALQQIARRGGQRAPVCRECSASHEDEGDGSQSDNEEGVAEIISDHDETDEKEKTDQSQQTTPTTPPADSDTSINSQRYILDTLNMTTATERQVIQDVEERKSSPTPNVPPGGSPISGILKGGRLWKQSGVEINNQGKVSDLQQIIDSIVMSDEESGSRRSVRFSESKEPNQRDVCDGAPAKISTEETKPLENESLKNQQQEQQPINGNTSASPESTEMMLTFKLGNHVLISNNSLKPNSAVRQLFPCTKPLGTKTGDEDSPSVHQYLVTAESLKAFEEAKRSKLPQIIQSGETDDSIRKAIERNTLRRSLIRYEPRTRKPVQKTDNSLVERIKQLTCNVEEDINQEADEISQRASPPGEEARNSPEVVKNLDKSFSPSSSSTTSSNSSSMSSTCRKFTDLFAKREKLSDVQSITDPIKNNQSTAAPDLGNGPQELVEHTPSVTIIKTNPAEPKKQFLSTLAPLTACVSGIGPTDDYYHLNNHGGDRTSIASSVGTEYSLEDIDEVLRKDEEESKKIAPDVLAGTPSASESGDELAMFVQQDAGRIERIKKKYQPEVTVEDDEHDDYGFNTRPSVRGIKPRFGSTTEILQQIQNQMQPPHNTPPRNHVAWPYYSETNLTGMDNNTKSRNINQNLPHYPYPNASAEDIKRSYASHQYRPNTYIEENIYQNCANQRCPQVNYRTNVNLYPPVVRVGGGCSDYYTSLPRNRNGRPQSPPPQEVSKNYHQTMVYIPYNHIEGYHPVSPNPYYSSTNEPSYARVTNQNQINKRYLEPAYQQRLNQPLEDHYQKTILRPSYPSSNHLVSSRSESPLPGQFSTARSTQTPVANISTCTYLPSRYRPMVGAPNAIPPNGLIWQEGNYGNKMNRHSFPRYAPSDSISLTDSDSQHSGQMPNGYRQPMDSCYNIQKDSMPNSPTKPRFIERGVPEGAASVSPQDSVNTAQNTSTMTSPTSPQNPPPPSTAKPLFYAMNV